MTRFKKFLAGSLTAVLVTLGLAGIVAAPASAHTPVINATCEVLNVSLTSYAAIVPGRDAVPGQAAVPEVKHTDAEYVQQATRYKYDKAKWDWNGWAFLVGWADSSVGDAQYGYWKADGQTGWGERLTTDTATKVNNTWYRYTNEQTKAENSGAAQWFHEGQYPGAPWVATGQTKPHVTQAYVPAVPAVPAVPEKANTVKVTIDGNVVVSEKFGTSWARSLSLGDKYVAHNYRVQVYSHDGIGNVDQSGTSKPCERPFDWNWQYPAPTCDGLTVTYPGNLPAGQSNDVNIRVVNKATGEERTFNFHNNTGTWSGTKTFNVKEHKDWPGWTWFAYTWTQVAGTNYHWSGEAVCGERPVPEQPQPRIETRKWTEQVCTEPADGTAKSTEYGQDTTYPVTFDRTTWKWVEGEGVTGEPYVISTKTVESDDCYVPPTPGAVIFVNHSCDAMGTFTVPGTAGVTYMITTDASNGVKARINAGQYFATNDRTKTGDRFTGKVTVEAWDTAKTALLDSWSFTFTEPTGCTKTPDTPTTTTPPVTGQPVVSTPAPAAPAAKAPAATQPSAHLAVTGSEALVALAAAVVLMAAGLVLVRTRRRRSQR